MRDCASQGHIEVDHDRVCLSCLERLVAGDWVAVHINRPEDHDIDLASPEEWGQLGWEAA